MSVATMESQINNIKIYGKYPPNVSILYNTVLKKSCVK